MGKRVVNFNPGPATLPLSALEIVQKEFLDYHGEGMSILEISHRSKTFDNLLMETESLIREISGFSEDYHVLFVQGGATGQFAAVPLNLSVEGKTAEYVNSGSWSAKAIKEAEKLGKPYRVIATSEKENFSYIPTDFGVGSDAAYLHITSNNTIYGTQWQSYPNTSDIPLVVDMSSDLYCRRLAPEDFSLIYAGAQKNAGPSGITIVIIKDELLERVPKNIPTIFNYKTFAEKHSMYNTPNTFGVYVVNLVMNWIKGQGGINEVEKINKEKAQLIYDVLDSTDYYTPHAHKDSRSLMNITWRLPSEDLEKTFVANATDQGLIGLKGHRSVGGIRASIYNAMTLEGIRQLVDFMKDFENQNG